MTRDRINTLNTLREDLSRVRKLILNQEQLINNEPDSFAYQLSLQSLKHRENEIEIFIADTEKELGIASLDLRLMSPEIKLGTIPLEVLGNAMIGLQRLVSSIAQALSSGPIERGPFSSEIIKTSQLQLSGIYPGSFGMFLEGIGEENLLGESLLKSTLNKFKEMLEIENEVEFVYQLEELGYRTINAYKDWLCKLESDEVTMEVKFSRDIGLEPIVKTPKDMIKIREGLVNIAEPKLEEVILMGSLTGANIRNGRFEFTSENQIISGKATTEVKETFKSFHLGENSKAIFDKETFEGISKTVWVMKSIEKVIVESNT